MLGVPYFPHLASLNDSEGSVSSTIVRYHFPYQAANIMANTKTSGFLATALYCAHKTFVLRFCFYKNAYHSWPYPFRQQSKRFAFK